LAEPHLQTLFSFFSDLSDTGINDCYCVFLTFNVLLLLLLSNISYKEKRERWSSWVACWSKLFGKSDCHQRTWLVFVDYPKQTYFSRHTEKPLPSFSLSLSLSLSLICSTMFLHYRLCKLVVVSRKLSYQVPLTYTQYLVMLPAKRQLNKGLLKYLYVCFLT